MLFFSIWKLFERKVEKKRQRNHVSKCQSQIKVKLKFDWFQNIKINIIGFVSCYWAWHLRIDVLLNLCEAKIKEENRFFNIFLATINCILSNSLIFYFFFCYHPLTKHISFCLFRFVLFICVSCFCFKQFLFSFNASASSSFFNLNFLLHRRTTMKMNTAQIEGIVNKGMTHVHFWIWNYVFFNDHTRWVERILRDCTIQFESSIHFFMNEADNEADGLKLLHCHWSKVAHNCNSSDFNHREIIILTNWKAKGNFPRTESERRTFLSPSNEIAKVFEPCNLRVVFRVNGVENGECMWNEGGKKKQEAFPICCAAVFFFSSCCCINCYYCFLLFCCSLSDSWIACCMQFDT